MRAAGLDSVDDLQELLADPAALDQIDGGGLTRPERLRLLELAPAAAAAAAAGQDLAAAASCGGQGSSSPLAELVE